MATRLYSVHVLTVDGPGALSTDKLVMRLFAVALAFVCVYDSVGAQRWFVSQHQANERVVGLVDLPAEVELPLNATKFRLLIRDVQRGVLGTVTIPLQQVREQQ